MIGTNQLRCRVITVGRKSFDGRIDAGRTRQAIIPVRVPRERGGSLFVCQATQPIDGVVCKIGRCNRVGCPSALIAGDIGALAYRVVGLRYMFRGNGIAAGLPLLQRIG